VRIARASWKRELNGSGEGGITAWISANAIPQREREREREKRSDIPERLSNRANVPSAKTIVRNVA